LKIANTEVANIEITTAKVLTNNTHALMQFQPGGTLFLTTNCHKKSCDDDQKWLLKNF